MRKTSWLTAFIFLSFTIHAQTTAGKLAIEQISSDSSLEIRSWIDEAMALSKTDTAAAESYFSKAILAARRNENWHLEGQAILKYAELLFQWQYYNRSFGQFYRGRAIYSELVKSDKDLVKMLMGVAKTQYHRSVYRKAAAHLLEAIELSRKLGDTDIEAEASEYLGLVYNAFHNFSASIGYFRRSLEIKSKKGETRAVANLASKLSDIYYERRRYDSALFFANLAFEGAEDLNLKTELYNARLSRTATFIRLKRFSEAENELSLLPSTVSKRDGNFSVRYQVLKGNYHMARNEKEKSMAYYDSALADNFRRGGFPELYGIIYKNMAESFYEAGDYQQAFDHARQHQLALSNLYAGENLKNLSSMEGILNTEISKDEIRLLNTENRLKQLELLREQEMRDGLERENSLMDSIIRQEKTLSDALSRENAYKTLQLANEKKLRTAETGKLNDEKKMRWSLLTGLVAVLVLGSIIFYQYKKQQKKRAIIEKQSDELQTLMKEIHHRVKNNLQIISSLLDLQSLTIKDSQASEAVKEGKNRVQSMALIHQNLYNEGNIRGISMESYINNLADSLFHSYNIRPEQVKMKTHIEEMNLDVDTVIPIGLILNELISNSLKYAFRGRAGGEISVDLVKQPEGSLLLKVKDNGNGFPPGAGTTSSDSFGMKMINAFAQKLKAKLAIYNDDGAVVEMRIGKYKTA
jgi:two-component system, sensor histidine kinase PdtaS